MLSHHKTGPLCIPLLYTLQHLSVCGHDSLHNTTFRCNKFADFDHEVIDRVKQQCEQRIVRSLGETSMEIGVLDGKEYRIFLDRFHFPNDATKILNVIFRGLLGCQADVLHFKKRTDLVQMIEADISTPRAQEQVQRLHHFFPAQCANGSADAMGGFQKAARSEDPNCFSNYAPTNSQALRELPFRRKSCTNGQALRKDLVLYGMDNTVNQRTLITYRPETNFSYFLDKRS